MMEIKNLTVQIGGKAILSDLSLLVEKGQVAAIMGPNGAGKSTLARVLVGDPAYEVVSGDILFEGQSILSLPPEERAHLGLFLSFQYPVEIPGVTNAEFLKLIVQSKRKAKGLGDDPDWEEKLQKAIELVEMRPSFLERGVNEGFSGGEKKKNEILQMALLEPSFAILDETDSGLDVDALKSIARGINALRSPSRSFLVITHYPRLLDLIVPDVVHVMNEGKIALTGDNALPHQIEKEGYHAVWSR